MGLQSRTETAVCVGVCLCFVCLRPHYSRSLLIGGCLVSRRLLSGGLVSMVTSQAGCEAPALAVINVAGETWKRPFTHERTHTHTHTCCTHTQPKDQTMRGFICTTVCFQCYPEIPLFLDTTCSNVHLENRVSGC